MQIFGKSGLKMQTKMQGLCEVHILCLLHFAELGQWDATCRETNETIRIQKRDRATNSRSPAEAPSAPLPRQPHRQVGRKRCESGSDRHFSYRKPNPIPHGLRTYRHRQLFESFGGLALRRGREETEMSSGQDREGHETPGLRLGLGHSIFAVAGRRSFCASSKASDH